MDFKTITGTLLIVWILLLFSSCRNAQDIPFPAELSEYLQPEVIPLELTDPQPINWDTLGSTQLRPTVIPLDLGRLKAMPYDPDGFQPVTSTKANFIFDDLPVTPFTPEKAEEIPLEWEVSLLPAVQPSVKFRKSPRISSATIDIRLWDQLKEIQPRPYSIAKDSAGILWIGGSKLLRFDGTTLTTVLDATPGFIYNLKVDRKGNLLFWMFSNNKETLNILDFSRNEIHSTYIKYIKGMMSVTSLDHDGNLWIGSTEDQPLIKVDFEKNSYALYDEKVGLPGARYYQASFDKQGRAWLGTRNGIDIVDPKKKQIKRLDKRSGLVKDTVFRIFAIPDGRIVSISADLQMEMVVDITDPDKGEITHFWSPVFSDLVGMEIGYDSQENLWFGRGGGLAILNPQLNLIRKVESEGLLPNQVVINPLEYQGEIFGLYTNNEMSSTGILQIGQSGQTVYPFQDEHVITIQEDAKRNLWVGTINSLFVVDSARKYYRQLNTTNGLAGKELQNMAAKDGKIIICTDGGYNVYDPVTSILTRIGKPEGLIIDSIVDVMVDRKGNKWMSGFGAGIVKYEKQSGLVFQFNPSEGIYNAVTQTLEINNRIWVIIVSKDPIIIDQENNTYQTIKNPLAIQSLANKMAMIDSRNHIWLSGSFGYGLYDIDPVENTITRFTTDEGLADNSLYSILEYQGKYFANTGEKINILTPPGLSENKRWDIQTVLHSDKLIKNGFSYMSDAISSDGSYLWGENGLAVIHPITPDTTTGKTLITGIKIMDENTGFSMGDDMLRNDTSTRKVNSAREATGYIEKGTISWDGLSAPYGLPENLSLPFDRNVIQFSFTELSDGRSDILRFAYVLEGVDKKWTTTTDLSSRTYINLTPGNYTFKVASKWKNGKWNEPATFSFTIRPPWYQTWWAYLLYTILIGALLRGYIIFRSRKLRSENRILEEKVNKRTEELQQKTNELQNKTDELQQSYNNVAQLEEIGKKITSSLSVEKIIGMVYKNVNALMDASVFGIGIYNEELKRLEFPSTYENGEVLPFYYNDIQSQNRLSIVCFDQDKEIIMGDLGKEHARFIQDIPVPVAGDQTASLIYLPLKVKEKILGVITVQSFKQNAYTEYHLNMLRNIAIYTAIALENAKSFEELKATQTQLIHSEKMASLGELTAGIAHEIQNPLNFVNNFSEINKELSDELMAELATGNLQLANEIAADIKGNSDKINIHGKRADAIVKGMLQHSRGASGQREMTDINALCDEYLRLSYHGLRARDKSFNARYEMNFDQNVGKINIVPQDIGRSALNLINNAFYAVNEKRKNLNGQDGNIVRGESEIYQPTVIVSTRKVDHLVEISVWDNGMGISKKFIEKIFQPFFTTKPTGKGTGLGLSLVYDIVKAHHGELRVNSVEGEGSEFVIQLPC